LVTNFQSSFTGEQPPVEDKGPPQGVSLDSFAGPVHVEWDTEAALTPLGQLPFFLDFLKAAGLFDRLGFDGGLGGEAEATALFLPVMRQVLTQPQQPARRQLDGMSACEALSIM
jgi:hypothetical protein